LALGGPDPTLILDATVLRWINQAYLEVCTSFDHPALEDQTNKDTSSGVAVYELETGDILKIMHCVDTTNHFQLVEIDCDLYGTFTQGDTSSGGSPTHWFESGIGATGYKEVTFWPTPAGTYTIEFSIKEKPADLVLDPAPTSAVINETWDDVILHFAVSRGWKILGDLEKSGYWRREGELIAQRARVYTERSPQEPRPFKAPISGAFRG